MGSIKFTQWIKPLFKKIKALTETEKKAVDKYLQKKKIDITNRVNSAIPLDSIFKTIANDLNIPLEQLEK